MSEGVRIKSLFLRHADLTTVRSLYEKAGFTVKEVIRTARYVTVKVEVELHTLEGAVCCRHDAEIKIGDSGVSFRWAAVAPRHYYHIETIHGSEDVALQSRATSTWALFEKANSKEVV